MILARVAKGRKVIVIMWLMTLYIEAVLPHYARGAVVRTGKRIYVVPAADPNAAVKPAAPVNRIKNTLPESNKKGNKVKKITAAAGDIGPGQPESGAFHPVNNTNMVDLFTGDFSYTIPLMDVGGYPIAIGYNSGVTMDQEASWVGLGWNINPGAITRNMRGIPDDFNGTDSIAKTASIKENKTTGATVGLGAEVVGYPISLSGSLGVFTNTYKGWGLEVGVNPTVNSAANGKGPLTAGISLTNNSQEGITLSPSLSVKATEEQAAAMGGVTGSTTIGTAYNSRTGMKALQLSQYLSWYGTYSSPLLSFAYPSYMPTISLPYTSVNFSASFGIGTELTVVHPSLFVSGYQSRQYIAPQDQHRSIPAYGYLNYQNGAADPGALLDYNREKDIPYREKPQTPNIGIPSYTYDVFSMTGEGTGGMFRAYRGDIGFVYDHHMRTKDASDRVSLDIGAGPQIVHGGVDLNYVSANTQSGPWINENPLAATIGFRKSDKLFEAAYFRNPAEKVVNTKTFYDAVGGDDAVTVDLFQPGSSSSTLSTTNVLKRYRNKNYIDNIRLRKDQVYKASRDKRTQVISYLTAKEASVAGLTKYIENYKLNTFQLENCDNTFPDETNGEGTGLMADYHKGPNVNHWLYSRLDSKIDFSKQEDMTNGLPPDVVADMGDEFSISWRGRLKADVTGHYIITTGSDDGAAVYINGNFLIDRWGVQGEGESTNGKVEVNLVAGEFYDIKVDYFQFRKKAAMKLYWEYLGHPREIIPTKFLYPPLTKDVFEVNGGNILKEKRVNTFRKENHISEIDVLNPDGRRYVYGLPVYNLKQQEATFSVNASDGNAAEGLVSYVSGTDDTTSNTKGNDHYFSREDMPAFAHSFLLTGILSPDYVDLTGNGVSDDDPGDAVKFNYTKVAGILNPYKWRTPYSDKAGYNEGLKTDNRDDKGNYVYGEKELWYLNTIESKNMIATFTVSDREDLYEIDRDGKKQKGPAKKLDEINLYTKADFKKHGTNATPVKTVHFSYSYKLCRGINAGVVDESGQVNDNGKLTLDSIWFTYNGNNKGRRNPYIFSYNAKNPRYNAQSYDRWGNYKAPLQNPGSTIDNVITNAEYPYALQDSAAAAENAAAWTLDYIVQPSGARMKITYESDDYAYVQNKQAAQLFKVAGFSASKPESVSDLTNKLYSKQNIYYTADHLYVGISVPKKVTSRSEVFERYLRGLNTTYFKLFVKMPSDKWGSGNEYVPCYAKLDYSDDGYGIIDGTDGNTIWIKMKAIDNNGEEGGSYSPLAKAAIQFLRLNLPSKAYPGSDVGENPNVGAVVKVIVGMADNIKSMFTSFDENARKKDWAKEVDLNRTYIRLNNPFFKKYGGGLRVKSIVTYDHWNAMTKQKEAEYGEEYQYTTAKRINGKMELISSGVASYEPMLGGEENPWRVPVQYKEQVAALAPVTVGYTEEPLGESFFPSPVVGYSKVRVRSIHSKNVRSANGYEETIFFTSYDFPTLTDRTELADGKKKYKPALANFLRINAKHFLAISQGFKVELNDMHGKLRSKATYAESDPDNYIAYTENFYHVDNLGQEFKHLNNTVAAITPQGIIDANASIGKDVEVMVDMREQRSVTNAYNLNLNTEMFAAGIIPWIIPSLFNLAQRDESKFRSVALTKVVSRHGIIDSVRAVDKGSRVSTANLLYDSETGEPVLTSTQNEFNDPVYHFNYPAAWAYDGMGGAYKNIGFTLDHVYMKEGRITQGLLSGTEASYFTGGDELLIWSHPKTYGSDCDPQPATFPSASKIWAIDANTMNGGPSDIYFVDADGVPFSGNDISMKIIRSGRRNINASVGEITMLENPVVGNSLVINTDSKIIGASATEFKQFWKAADRKKAGTVTNCVPAAYNIDDCTTTTYGNQELSHDFVKECTSGTGSVVTYTVPAGKYTSIISQEDADAQAQADIDSNGQAYANANGVCSGPPCRITVRGRTEEDVPDVIGRFDVGVISDLTNSAITYTTDPPSDLLANPIPYCILFDKQVNENYGVSVYTKRSEGIYVIVGSEEKFCPPDVLQEFELRNPSEIIVSTTPRPVYWNSEQYQKFSKSGCDAEHEGSLVRYTVPAYTYSSYESLQDANNKAIADINANGQAYADANNNGICVLPGSINTRTKPGANGSGGRFDMVVKNEATQEEVFSGSFLESDTPPQDLSLPTGSYIVKITSTDMSGLKATVNGDETSISSGGFATWTTSHTIVVETASLH
ncbi:MAG TPA: DUF5977 domain-containing protein [Chitinophaga sp.]|uniref:DUF5977 domain-containing protein n=1 Tax=Chitinophaga sp. TaxID=1869181 RepID=UPI002DB70799|nr:DUF5977 domain-containing protein [Chitinophaga sp.]HEU4553604.1 DUF5977 domain-containing protein [Chitinophaga sp.]